MALAMMSRWYDCAVSLALSRSVRFDGARDAQGLCCESSSRVEFCVVAELLILVIFCNDDLR
jgi:hypothetical protein